MRAMDAIRDALLRRLVRQFLLTHPAVAALPWIATAVAVALPIVVLIAAAALEPRDRC